MTEPGQMRLNARPRLASGVRLTYSEPQGGWLLLAPERAFRIDAIALEVLNRCTGAAILEEIVDDLALKFTAPPGQVLADVSALLARLQEKRLLELA